MHDVGPQQLAFERAITLSLKIFESKYDEGGN
jgi:hypothetical protein